MPERRTKGDGGLVRCHTARTNASEPEKTMTQSAENDAADSDRWTCILCGHEGHGSDQVEWFAHTTVCPGRVTPAEASEREAGK